MFVLAVYPLRYISLQYNLKNDENCLGKQSFKDLLYISGHYLGSYKEVCCCLGILVDSEEWEKIFSEAVSSLLSSRARQLFTVMLLFCELPDPTRLFHKFFDHFVDDIRRRSPTIDDNLSRVFALREISGALSLHSRRLEDFNLPCISDSELQKLNEFLGECHIRVSACLRDETDFDISAMQSFLDLCLGESDGCLSQSQRNVFDHVKSAMEREEQCVMFIDARGGTGKTYLLNSLLSYARISNGNIQPALAVATSGIAATQLHGGRTFHSRFRAPLEVHENSVLDISVQTDLASVIRQSRLIVWDEAPMAHRFHLEALDRSLRDITNKDCIFGGKSLVLAGDFR